MQQKSITNFEAMDESFGKNEKLKSKKIIETLFREGRSVKKYPLTLIYLPLTNPEINSHKTGISVPKKLVKNAVDRNRIKRLIREAFRKNKYLVKANDSRFYGFMIIFTSREEPAYDKLLQDMQLLLKKFKEKVDQEKIAENEEEKNRENEKD